MNVGADFLATMQIPVILGRGIGEREVQGASAVVVVNEPFVKTYFGGENPIGGTSLLAAPTRWMWRSSAWPGRRACIR